MKVFVNMIKNGLQTIHKEPYKLIVVVIYVLIVLLIIDNVSTSITSAGMVKNILLCMAIPSGTILIVILLGIPTKTLGYRKALERIGLKNKRGEIPLLVSCSVDNNRYIFVF